MSAVLARGCAPIRCFAPAPHRRPARWRSLGRPGGRKHERPSRHRPVPRLELRAGRDRGDRRVGRRPVHPLARRPHGGRRRRGGGAGRLRPRRLPPPRRDRPVLARHGRGHRIRRRRRSGRRHLQRLPGAHRGRTAAGRIAEEPRPEVPVHHRRDPGRDRAIGAHRRRRGRGDPPHPDQPLRGQLHLPRRGPGANCATRTVWCSATSTTPTDRSTTSPASARRPAMSWASCRTRSGHRTRSWARPTACHCCVRCSPAPASGHPADFLV